MKKRSILTAIVAGILSIGLIGCGGSNSSNGDDKVIKVGVSPVPHEEIMEVAKPLLEAKGYKVEIVEFTDYVLPNTSLENGELDANYFQHIAYLNSFNADNGTHLTYTAEILKYINSKKSISIVATHDRELTEILKDNYEFFYFSEKVDNAGLKFDYKLKKGISKTRNAIKLLDFIGYPKEIIKRSYERAEDLEKYM